MEKYCGKTIDMDKAYEYIDVLKLRLDNSILIVSWIWDLNWLEFKIE